MPIKIDGSVIAVLDIQQVLPGHLTQRDLNLMSSVADQLAVALQRATLYTNLQQALEHEKFVQAQMIQSEKLVAVGRLLASVSHELNNPLQAIQNALFLLKDEKGISEQGRQDLEIVILETERMAVMIDRLRESYRSPRTETYKPVFLNTVIEEVYALVSTHLRHKEISFEFHPAPDLQAVPGFADQLRQVILNLLMNAVEAMIPGGHLSISTQRLQEQGRALLVISDTGPGVDPEILPHIFEAFVTNKESGTGLGLTISYDIIRKHAGEIVVENNPGGGAKFSIWLPLERQDVP
jgi:signal transduction histidine kinase